jgi:Mn2+/Fe2+ NRAMP family transporter
VWAVALGTLCLIFLAEMSGRIAAVSGHTIAGAMRERFGFPFFLAPLVAVLLISLLVLASEVGGICLALQLATGVKFPWWAPVAALALLIYLWKGNFSVIEKAASILGLVTLVFLLGAFRLGPPYGEVAHGLLPTLPTDEKARYWFIAVSILGASISPYLFFFYSAGAVEEEWDESYLATNKIVSTLGMLFGGVLAIAVLVVAALVYPPRGIKVDDYSQVALILTDPLGRWGFILFIVSLGVACFGAAAEICLASAYLVAQGLGWNWTKNEDPKDNARFTLVYTGVAILAALLMITGLEPLKLTIFSMALTALALPPSIVPFLVIMNDERYVGRHRNGWFGNSVVLLTICLAFVIAIVAIPLEVFGGS